MCNCMSWCVHACWVQGSIMGVISKLFSLEVRPFTEILNFTSSVKLAGHQDQGSGCLHPHNTGIMVYNPELRFGGYVDLWTGSHLGVTRAFWERILQPPRNNLMKLVHVCIFKMIKFLYNFLCVSLLIFLSVI